MRHRSGHHVQAWPKARPSRQASRWRSISPGWSTNNYVLIPASVYNGNRNRIEYRGYCTGFNAEDFYNKDLPVTHGDVPRLELEPGKPSKIEVNASNATTPAMCFYNRQTERAFILLAEQGIREGGQILDNGLMIEESPDRSRATLVVSAPGVRERKPEFIGFSASPDRGIDWKTGKEVTLRLRVYSFATPDIPGLLEKFMTVRKAVTGPNHPRNLIPFSEVIRLMTGRIDSRWHENTAGQYYCPENCDIICLGWVGGLMNTFPMLALGDEMHRERAYRRPSTSSSRRRRANRDTSSPPSIPTARRAAGIGSRTSRSCSPGRTPMCCIG